jgi:tetratricopeptide (TPR) repeat protein
VRGKWYLKALQSKAFCCFKQYRFTEALSLFKQQEALMGPSAPLCENIGHVCSSLADYDQAERYFRLATQLLPVGRQHSKNSGGVYLGLGLLLDRRNKPREALPVLYQSLELYQDSCYATGRFVESSLVAKAHMSTAHAHEHVNELGKAEEHMRTAVGIFSRTVGDDSPLLAGALGALGKVRHAQGELADALVQLRLALALEIKKDAFHLRTVWELFEEIKVGAGLCAVR